MKRSSRKKRQPNVKRQRSHLIFVFLLFLAVWALAVCAFVVRNGQGGTNRGASVGINHEADPNLASTVTSTTSIKPTPRLLSRRARISADVRGNLGPASVLLNNGTDWLKDRWQAASDMHGTAIAGSHWIQMHFVDRVRVTRIILDWETAYSNDYSIQGCKVQPPPNDGKLKDGDCSVLLFDTRRTADVKHRSIHQYGQSPGVPKTRKLPLHVIHALDDLPTDNNDIWSLRIGIRRPYHAGWGVSLWRVEVYGYGSVGGD